MNDKPDAYLRGIAERYQSAGCPERESWFFDDGQNTSEHQELAREGLIERLFGTPRGSAWRLTAAGAARAAKLGE